LHRVVDVSWSEQALVLVVENDYDSDGEALGDEFSDTVAAYASGPVGFSIRILAVTDLVVLPNQRLQRSRGAAFG
jgi:hypothetical protein